jgi:hypothetical protein
MVRPVPAASYRAKQQAIISERDIPGIASIPISRQMDDSIKRTKNTSSVCRSSSNISVFIKELTFKIRTGEFRKKSF